MLYCLPSILAPVRKGALLLFVQADILGGVFGLLRMNANPINKHTEIMTVSNITAFRTCFLPTVWFALASDSVINKLGQMYPIPVPRGPATAPIAVARGL